MDSDPRYTEDEPDVQPPARTRKRHSRAQVRHVNKRHKERLLRHRRAIGWPVEVATKYRDRCPCSCLACRNPREHRTAEILNQKGRRP